MGPGTSGLCRSWLAPVECPDHCKTLHSQTLRNAQVLEVAGLVSCPVRACEPKMHPCILTPSVSCPVRACELVECLAELVRRLLDVSCSNGCSNCWR
jgi:hypothetical protein